MKITILEPVGAGQTQIDEFKEVLKTQGHSLTIFDTRPERDDEIVHRAGDSDVIIVSNLPLSSNVINKCENLKMISIAFTGFDQIDISTCKKRGIVVCNSAGYSTDSVAELAVGLMISVLRKIVWGDSKTRALSTREGFLGTELKGKTVGVIGTGAIGTRVTELLRAFGCTIIAYSRTKKPGIEFVELDTLLAKSDIVTLHVPLNRETRHLINRDNLKLMKSKSIIINTARGGVIDNHALAEALTKGVVAGAGLDSVDMEPPLPSGYPLLSAPNTVLAPHIGYATDEAIERRTQIVFENVLSYLRGSLQNRVA
ncbi:glycerate dehydrogenase [archaeon BMS3Abin16]|nr:glycerate dehydrogenase [archaeon BMS3Abin16]